MIKKVCLITQDFFPKKGGIASYLLGVYYKYFNDIMFEVIVPDNIGTKEDFKNLPFKVHQTSFRPFNINDSERHICNGNILNILEEIKPDVILFGYLRSHTETGLIYKKSNPNTVIGLFVHAKEVFIDSCIVNKTNKNDLHKGYSEEEVNFYKNILNSVDIIFSVSNFTKELLQKQGIKSNIVVLTPSIRKMQSIVASLARELIGIDKDCLVLLSVGRLIKRKGQKKIIELIPELKKIFPKIKYLIVGEGPEFDNLTRRVEELNIENEVIILRSIEDEKLNLFYSACDIFVLPCEFIAPNDVEGFGIAFLEANSFGKPCIGGDSGGVPEAVLDNETGLLVNPKSEKDMLNKIILLLDNKQLRNKLGKKGLERVSLLFNYSKSDFLIKCFENIKKDRFHP